jgi:hypothetical protein
LQNTEGGTANHIITIDTKLAPHNTRHSQKSDNTTNTICHGEKKCQSEIQFVTGHDSRNSSSRKSLFLFSNEPQCQKSKKVINNEQIIIMPEMANAVIFPETGKSLKHQELITKLRYKMKWMRSTANEINRIYNTNTIRFIRRSNIPKGRKVTYGSFLVDIKDHKEEKERTRLTLGGDHIEYPGDKSTRTAGLTTAKNLINSVISTLGAKFLVIDINKKST